MSLQQRNKTSGILETVAGFTNVDSILSSTSKNAIMNKTVYNALAQKVEKTVTDLVNYYDTSQVYNKAEVRQLIGAINTLTISVVANLPTSDISTTTIYLVGPASGTNKYDEYVYVNSAWAQIGDTTIDLSQYVTSANLTTILQSYYTKTAIDALLANYYTKTEADTLLNGKQDILIFDDTPTQSSDNPVKSGGIYTAINNATSSINTALNNKYGTDDTAETTLADDDNFPFYDTSASAKRKITWANIVSKFTSLFVPKRANEYGYFGLGAAGANPSVTTVAQYVKIHYPIQSTDSYSMKHLLLFYKHRHGQGQHGIISIECYTDEYANPNVLKDLTAYIFGNIPYSFKIYWDAGTQNIYLGPVGTPYSNVSIISALIHDTARNADFRNLTIEYTTTLPSTVTEGTTERCDPNGGMWSTYIGTSTSGAAWTIAAQLPTGYGCFTFYPRADAKGNYSTWPSYGTGILKIMINNNTIVGKFITLNGTESSLTFTNGISNRFASYYNVKYDSTNRTLYLGRDAADTTSRGGWVTCQKGW